MQIHGQIAMLLDRFLNAEDVRKDLALIVRCAARENVAVLQDRLERRRIPKLQWIWWLHIVMAVNQNCAPPGLVFVARPDNWVAFRGYELRLQADAVQLLHQPVCALAQLLLVLIIGRNTWKPQERIILFEIIVAHGQKSKPGLLQTSTTQRTPSNCRVGASPAPRKAGKRSACPTTATATRLLVRSAK